MRQNRPTVGILAVQGAFVEHARMLEGLGARCVELRQLPDLERGLDALVLPGGESTVQAKLLHDLGMFDPLRDLVASGVPTLGTCAGLILLAEAIDGDGSRESDDARVDGLRTLPVTVRRNAYGRQLGSFRTTCDLRVAADDVREVPATFIRAPRIERTGAGVEALAEVGGAPVLVRRGNQLGCAFHPELDADPTIHELLLSMVIA